MSDAGPKAWFDNGVALVTGSAVRIGQAMVFRLAEMGINVAIHYRRSADDAFETAGHARSLGVDAVAFQADLCQGEDTCRQLVRDVTARLGPPNVLINNASWFETSSLEGLSEQHWEAMLAVNLRAPAFLCQAVTSQLDSARGHFIQMVDWRGTSPIPGHFAYTIAKAGLVAMTKLLAQELAPAIQVNGIAPGAILPPLGGGPEFLEKVAQQVPLKRTGSPRQVADAMEYLLRADFVTGEVLHLTGGQHLSSVTRGGG